MTTGSASDALLSSVNVGFMPSIDLISGFLEDSGMRASKKLNGGVDGL